MSSPDPADELSEERRRAIFLALADAEDLQEMPRPLARQLVARRFGITEAAVAHIEREGMEELWPPL
jgi:hypothetical protein